MAKQAETEWQSERTLAECMRYMLDNEISTDVCFEVGPTGGETVKIRAHKYMLISRSPVFEAMFSSGMTECSSGPEAKIRIEDIDADIFKEVLNYIYCESISICPESAVYVMYAAKKYLLPNLVRECRKCLLESLDINNVIHILEQSLHFDHQQLVNDCLRLISLNAKTVLTGAEILSASRQVMEAVLEAQAIPVRESVIYKTTIKWAKHQLQSTIPTENPTDLQIRETIGDLLYKIRFPVMKPRFFAEICGGNNVLTAEEKESVYYFSLTKKKNSQLKFPTERRMGEEVWIDETVNCASTEFVSAPNACLDAIDFTTGEDILLTGIGLHTEGRGKRYDDVEVEILQSVNSLFKKSVTVPYSADSNPIKIPLDKPIVIIAGVLYSVKTSSHDRNGCYWQLCQSECTKETVNFAFSRHIESLPCFETRGEIRQLYFCYL